MSLLDTIKSLFCKLIPDNPASEDNTSSEANSALSSKQKDIVTQIKIPEDSTLKRHVLSALQAEIESGLPARPTDSTLKRHYDALVQSELDKKLAQ